MEGQFNDITSEQQQHYQDMLDGSLAKRNRVYQQVVLRTTRFVDKEMCCTRVRRSRVCSDRHDDGFQASQKFSLGGRGLTQTEGAQHLKSWRPFGLGGKRAALSQHAACGTALNTVTQGQTRKSGETSGLPSASLRASPSAHRPIPGGE